MIRELTTSGSITGEKERLQISQNESEAGVSLNPEHEPGLVNGLTTFTAALFIVGEMAGGAGILALPEAVTNTGWTGVILIIVMGILACTCGIVLSRSWLILRRDFREYREHVRYPYPAVGFHTYGKTGKYVVQFCINVTLVGTCTVFILLASDNLHSLIDLNLTSISARSEYRVWLAICTAVLLPLTWLGTPKNFWPVALFANIATSVALLLILIKIGVDFDGVAKTRHVTTTSYFSAFGAIAFAFGGISAFPTIQCDMKQQSKFNSSIVLAHIVIVLMYLPISTLGFLAFGDDVQTNVLMNLSSTSGITKCVEALVTTHVLLGFVILLNPVSQQLEEWLNVPKGRVTLKSCLVRSFLMLFILGLAQGIPHFGMLLNLLGSSTMTLLIFVFPCLFYLKLEPNTSLHMKVFLCQIMVVGTLAAVTSTYFAVKDIIQELS